MIKIIFLGTGTSQGIPVIGSNHPVCKSNDPKDKRLRVSIALKWDNFFFVVDWKMCAMKDCKNRLSVFSG